MKKTLKLIALAVFAMLFSQCKTTAPTASSGPAPSLFEVAQILDSAESKFLGFTELNNGNAHQAIMQTLSWVQSQPNVQSATALDSVNITIVLKSGLHTIFFFDEVGADSMSLFKGGGGSGSSKELNLSESSDIQAKNTITNKNVLIYCAGCNQFYKNNEIQTTVNILSGSSAGLNVTLLKDDQCTYPIVDHFRDYGFVIIDTHGFPDGFMIGTTVSVDATIVSDDLFNASIAAQGGQDMLDKLLSGKLSFFHHVKGGILHPYWWRNRIKKNTFSLSVFLTSKYIDALPPMPSTVIFGSMCYSGWGVPLATGYTPIKTSFMNKNPISYYCFAYNDGTSAPAGVIFAKKMEDTLSKDLSDYLDSTKIANLQIDNKSEYSDPDPLYFFSKLYFKHFGADDYSYPVPCGDTLIDSRDNQKYATVCIGKQIWMAQNLNFDTVGASCYNNDPANCAIYGKLYDFTTLMQGAAPSNSVPSHVQGVCPKGWHVPSDSEYRIMANFLDGNAGNAGVMIKSTSSLWQGANVGATNSSGFSALPGGSGDSPNVNFKYIGQSAYFQTSSGLIAPTYIAANLWICTTYNTGFDGGLIGDELGSCRCVKDQ